MSRARRALVTGSTGFIGINLIRELLDRGWQVFALHRASSDLTYLAPLPVTRVVADIVDAGALVRVVPEGLDALFHVAASTNMWSRRNEAQTRTNVEGTRNVVRAALERGVRRLVHTSSIAAYGLHDEPVRESTPTTGRSSWINYLRTKALAEDEVRAGLTRGLDGVILNPANVVGPYDVSSWSTLFYLVHARKLPAVAPGRASFAHVREVVRAHVEAFERGRGGENYLLGGADASYLEMIRIIARLTSRPEPARATPALVVRLGARLATWQAALRGSRPRFTPEQAALMCADFVCRSDKAIHELRYRPVALETMLADCHRWMAEEGRLR